MDIRKIVKSAGKTHAYVSKLMFPDAKYPYQAYTRVASQGIHLNEFQLNALAEATGYSICQIMEMRAGNKRHVGKVEYNG